MENNNGWKKTAYFFIIGFIVGVISVVMIQNIRTASNKSGVENLPTDDATSTVATVFIKDQNAGDTVSVSSVSVPETSWVAVRENNYDVMGRILGAQKVQPGKQDDVTIELLRPTSPYVMYAIVLYQDDGDGVFDYQTDTPIENEDGSEIFARFSAN